MNKYVGESERAVREVRKGKLWIMLDTKLPWLSNSSLRLPLNFLKNSFSCKFNKENKKMKQQGFLAFSCLDLVIHVEFGILWQLLLLFLKKSALK